MNVIEIEKIPFSLDITLSSGQVFQWKKINDWWHGLINQNIFFLRQREFSLEIKTQDNQNLEDVIEYFRLKENISEIHRSISRDIIIKKLIANFGGLRIIRQDPWECLLSYICSTNMSIPGTDRMLDNLAIKFGKRKKFKGEKKYVLPDVRSIANTEINEIKDCGLGYRSRYVKEVAVYLSEHKISLEKLRTMDLTQARDFLLEKNDKQKKLCGVGPKVADCVLLFSLDKMSAFPIDRWIERQLNMYYKKLFEEKLVNDMILNSNNSRSLSPRQYNVMNSTMRQYFGSNAGYAQELLFLNRMKT